MLKELGPMSNEEKKVIVVFLITAFFWIFRQLIDNLPGLALLDDSVIAISGAVSLFFIKERNNKNKLLIWDDVQNGFPWGLIFLFGGEVIRGFMFALMVGVIIGTYSSIFVASPILKFFKVSYKTLEKEEEKIIP